MDKSKLKLHSIGIVVEDKPDGEFIKVAPMEELYIQDNGLIVDHEDKFDGKKGSINSVNFNTEHESREYIRAKWLDISGGNRATPPDVVKNESVLLLKYGEVDEYFWCDLGHEPALRRLEDVIYSYSNLPSGIKEYDPETSYWVRISTKDKLVHVHTSDNDGENTTYDIRINTAAGNLSIVDGNGNNIILNSATGVISMEATSEIIRKAPKITDVCSQHTVTGNLSVGGSCSISGRLDTSGPAMANPNLNARCTCPNCS